MIDKFGFSLKLQSIGQFSLNDYKDQCTLSVC